MKLPEWRPRSDFQTLEKRLGYRFADRSLLLQALTPQHSGRNNVFQMLEYHGDACLRYVVPHLLCERYAQVTHGEVSKMYSKITCNTNLAFMAYRLRLPYYLRFPSRPLVNRKLLADVLEALIGAIDRASGIDAVMQVSRTIFKLDLEIARFQEPQDTLLRLLQQPGALELIREQAPEGSPLRQLKARRPQVSYQLHVIHKRCGKLGHVSVLRLNGHIVVQHGEGYDAESANNNAASLALLTLFPKHFKTELTHFTWKI